tara:strand:+ start:5796 stop:6299 length:504 start_codon:yes stop_codon:yes gene_type:complete
VSQLKIERNEMNNWKAFYDLQKKKESNKKDLNKKRLVYLAVFVASMLFGSLVLAVISSAALAKLLFGSLFGILAVVAFIAHFVCYYWVIAAIFQDDGVGGGILFLFLSVITCYIWYVYYSFMNCNALVAALGSFGAFLSKALAAAAVYTYTGGAFTILPFGFQIVPV